jgi:hypothetical protein
VFRGFRPYFVFAVAPLTLQRPFKYLVPTIAPLHDPALSATVLARTALRYSAGADAAADRPAHVRAGSSLAWLGLRLAAVQDDANFIALVDPGSGRVDSPGLADGRGGASAIRRPPG